LEGDRVKDYARKPCDECPWRTDVAPGRFPPERFRVLAKTAYDVSWTMFGCHKSPEGREFACAGFILVGATHNLGFRFALRDGRIDPEKVSSPFPLFASYRAMAIANGVPADDPDLEACRDA
jgi:hypothetical protein